MDVRLAPYQPGPNTFTSDGNRTRFRFLHQLKDHPCGGFLVGGYQVALTRVHAGVKVRLHIAVLRLDRPGFHQTTLDAGQAGEFDSTGNASITKPVRSFEIANDFQRPTRLSTIPVKS